MHQIRITEVQLWGCTIKILRVAAIYTRSASHLTIGKTVRLYVECIVLSIELGGLVT